MKNVYGAIEPVPMSAIRGEFGAASALIEKKTQERREANERSVQQQRAKAERLEQTAKALRELGVNVKRDLSRDRDSLTISGEDAEKLLDLLRKA